MSLDGPSKCQIDHVEAHVLCVTGILKLQETKHAT